MGSLEKPRQVVLVVEDDGENAQSLTDLLDIMGYQSEVADHGGHALAMLREHPGRYCLILLDLAMPVMDGETFLVTQQGEAAIAEIPVVLLTAALSAEAALKHPAVAALVSKPVDAEALEMLLERHC